MAKSYHNIESDMSRWNNARNSYRVGHSNIGMVYIYGTTGKYEIRMGQSIENHTKGIAGLYVMCPFLSTLEIVSRVIGRLQVEERDGLKIITQSF